MDGRTRRRFMGLGIGALVGLSGCLGTGLPGTGGTNSPTPANGNDAEALSFNHAERLHRVDADFPQQDAPDHYLALLSTEDHAAAFPTERFRDEAASEFLDETPFPEAVVVAVHDRWSSSVPDLELRSANVAGGTVSVRAEYPGQAGTDDVTTDTMLVRVRTEASVTAAEATIQPQYGEPVRLSTEDEDATAAD